MLDSVDKTHVRRSLTSDKRDRFPLFGTSFGWLGLQMRDGSLEQDIAGEVGIAIVTYFKQLKCVIAMLIMLTIVSIPQFIILSLQFGLRGETDLFKLNLGLFS